MHKATVLFLAVAIGLGLICLHLVREVRSERANVQALQARVSELQRAAARPSGGPSVTMPPAQIASPFAHGQRATSTAQAAASPPAKVANRTQSTAPTVPLQEQEFQQQMQENMERQRTLLRDPEYRDAMRTQYKMMQARAHPDAAKELDLTPEQADRLFTLLAEQQLRGMDIADFPRRAGGELDASQVQELRRKTQEYEQQNRAEIAGLLGPKFGDWQEYQSTMGVRWQANQMRAALASKGMPLDEQLAKPLLKVLVAQQQQMMSQAAVTSGRIFVANNASAPMMATGEPDAAEQTLEHRARYNKSTREALASILSAEQLEVLEEEENAELQMQRAQLKIMRAQQEAAGTDPTRSDGIMFRAPMPEASLSVSSPH